MSLKLIVKKDMVYAWMIQEKLNKLWLSLQVLGEWGELVEMDRKEYMKKYREEHKEEIKLYNREFMRPYMREYRKRKKEMEAKQEVN